MIQIKMLAKVLNVSEYVNKEKDTKRIFFECYQVIENNGILKGEIVKTNSGYRPCLDNSDNKYSKFLSFPLNSDITLVLSVEGMNKITLVDVEEV